jgi:hypothetical protein
MTGDLRKKELLSRVLTMWIVSVGVPEESGSGRLGSDCADPKQELCARQPGLLFALDKGGGQRHPLRVTR